METIEVGKLKPNPFRSVLGSGFDEAQIGRLTESFKMSRFGEGIRFEVRQKDGVYQLVYGHHRAEALKRLWGRDHMVEFLVRDYSNEQMLVEMVRENLTKETSWFARKEAIRAAQKYLEATGVGSPDTCDSKGRKKHQKTSQGIGARQIAEFLSKDGRTVSKDEVATVLKIAEKVPAEEVRRDGITRASFLARFDDEEERKDIGRAMKKCKVQNSHALRLLISEYQNSSPHIQQQVRAGTMNLAELDEDYFVRSTKERNKKKAELSQEDMRPIISHLGEAMQLVKQFPLKEMHEADRNVIKQTYLEAIETLQNQIKEAEGG